MHLVALARHSQSAVEIAAGVEPAPVRDQPFRPTPGVEGAGGFAPDVDGGMRSREPYAAALADAIETVRVYRAQLVIATARLRELLEGHDYAARRGE